MVCKHKYMNIRPRNYRAGGATDTKIEVKNNTI
jgi:hypothetical protein